MSDWLTYSPSDLLMFGPEVYRRLFVVHNQALWPLPAIAGSIGVAILLVLRVPGRWKGPVIWITISLAWIGAAHFLATRYAPINWPMDYAAWAFGVEAALVLAAALAGALTAPRPRPEVASRLGFGILVYAMLVHPVIGVAQGRLPAEAEVFGLAPDPTALASLGLLLLTGRRSCRALLCVLPIAWCVLSAATLLSLGEPEGWILLAALGLWFGGVADEAIRARARRPE